MVRRSGRCRLDLEMFERDYLMREVRKIVELLARIAQLRTSKEHEVALEEIGSAYDRLGVSRGMLDFLDPTSLIRMVGSAALVLAIGRLMEEEAMLLPDPRAQVVRARAATLIDAATAAGASLD